LERSPERFKGPNGGGGSIGYGRKILLRCGINTDGGWVGGTDESVVDPRRGYRKESYWGHKWGPLAFNDSRDCKKKKKKKKGTSSKTVNMGSEGRGSRSLQRGRGREHRRERYPVISGGQKVGVLKPLKISVNWGIDG